MSNSNFSKVAEIKAILEAKKQAFQEENELQIEKARQQAEATVQQAQREANVLIGNATYQYIYYIHNNIIHQIDQKGNITPFVKNTFGNMDPAQLKVYQNAMKDYNKKMKDYKPYINKWIVEKRPNKIFPLIQEEHKVLKRIRNPKRAPLRPIPPRPQQVQFNAAVSDIIVDIPSNKLYWGRWADPYKIISMDIDTHQITELFDVQDMVTSVALDTAKGHIYWLEGNRFIKRGNMNGQGQPIEFLKISAPDKGGLWQLEIDTLNRRLYWTNDISLWRADIDNPRPTSLMVVAPFESTFPIDLAVDPYNGYLYWIDADLKKIRRSDLEGINVVDLYDLEKPTRGLKVDHVANLLYWSDEVDGQHALQRGSTQNPAIRLDGKDDFIEIPHFAPGKSFTIEMWVNPISTKDRQCFIGKHTKSGSNIVLLGFYSNQFYVELKGKSRTIANIKREGLQHIAMTVSPRSGSSSNVNFYFNGKNVLNIPFSATPGQMTGLPWFIGKDVDPTGHNDFFDGAFQELRIWSTERTAAEINNYQYQKLTGDEEGLEGYWLADALQGNILPDLSKNGRHGTLVREGNKMPTIQKTLQLDGKTNYIQVPPCTYSFEHGMSIEAWVYYDKFQHWSRIIDFGNGMLDNIIFSNVAVAGNLNILIRNAGSAFEGYQAVGVLELKKWMHVAITLDPDRIARMYKNGKLVKEKQIKFFPREVERTTNYIGKSNFADNKLFDGKMSELRIWNRNLSQQELLDNLHKRVNSQSEGLIGYFPLNEGSGNVIHDRSVNNNNGKLMDKFFEDKIEIKNKNQELGKLISQRDATTKRLNEFNATIKKIKDLNGAIQSTKNNLNNAEKKRNQLKADREKNKKAQELLIKKKTDLFNRIMVINVKIATIGSEIAGLTVAAVFSSSSRAQLKKKEKELAATKKQSQKLNKDMAVMDKKINALGKKITQQQNEINHLNKSISEFQSNLKIWEEQIRNLEVSIRNQNQDELITAEELAFKKVKILEDEIAVLMEKVGNATDLTWIEDAVPINAVIEKDYEVETIMEVPGLDGMALVPVGEYLAAKRKKAFDHLLNTKKQKEAERAQAEALARAKRKAARDLQLKKEAEAAKLKADGLANAAAKKEAARNRKRQAERNAEKKKTAAEKDKRKKVATANNQAAQKRKSATDYKRNRINQAQRKKNAAQDKVDRARDEKKRLIG